MVSVECPLCHCPGAKTRSRITYRTEPCIVRMKAISRNAELEEHYKPDILVLVQALS